MRTYHIQLRELYWMLSGDLNGKEIQKEGLCVYTQPIPSAVQQKLTQHGKATVPQQEFILKSKNK